MLDVDGDAVRLFVDGAKEIRIIDLGKGTFRKFLVVAKGSQRILEKVRAHRLLVHTFTLRRGL